MYLASWSGGKDSCLACYKAIKQGYQIKYLLNFISREYKRGCFHGIEARLLKQQAEAIGIPLVQKEVSPDMKEYEKEFKEAVLELKNKFSLPLLSPVGEGLVPSQFGGSGDHERETIKVSPTNGRSGKGKESINSMVFGDIYLDEHKEWVERVCRELGIEAIEPLWNVPAEEVVREFIDAGFKAVVVSAKADLFNGDFIGRRVDDDLVKELNERHICPCGENGEFHTFVVDGPIFKQRIEVTKSQSVLKEGFWKHWFLDIQEWRILNKAEKIASSEG